MFGIIFPFLAAGFDEKTCLLPANYHPPHQTVINIPRHSPLPTLPLLELQTKVREYFTIMEMAPTSVLTVKALLGAFNEERALIGAFSVIVKYSRTFVCSSSV